MTSTFKSILSNPAAALHPALTSTPELGRVGTHRQQMHCWMQECRAATLALFDDMTEATFCRQSHPDFSPVGWHLGHIAYTEALWLWQRTGHPPLLPPYHRLFAQDGLPKGDRGQLPPIAEVRAYLDTVRAHVFNYLQQCPIIEQERLWYWLLQHESQHCETIAIVLELQKKHHAASLTPRFATPLAMEMVAIPAGAFAQGDDTIAALDNETPSQPVHLATYCIDRTPVTCAQYQAFMAAAGYHTARWWSAAGWQWRQSHQIEQPLYWRAEIEWANHPVCGVSYYEAEAYANFVGKRLPTEAEWEKAASWQPDPQGRVAYPWGNEWPTADRGNFGHHYGMTTAVDRFPQGQSPAGCYDLLGNVWEWTSSWFAPYPHFTAYPYPGYSQAYFDGEHRVLRGGSWATRPWALRNAFRNWYHPHMRQMLAGFRCAQG